MTDPEERENVVLHVSGSESRVPDDPFQDRCPKCGSAELIKGFGLAFGGMGPYQFCDSPGCDWATKHPLPEDEC